MENLLIKTNIFLRGIKMNQGEIEQKKPSTKNVVIVGAVIVIVVLAVVAYSVLTSFVNRPNPEITMVDGHGGLQGLIMFIMLM
jgi:hypothetical protein